jgi:hypothetical protein
MVGTNGAKEGKFLKNQKPKKINAQITKLPKPTAHLKN